MLDPSNLCQNDIAESAALQKWLVISYKVTDEEGLPALIEVINAEWKLGCGGLPTRFQKYF